MLPYRRGASLPRVSSARQDELPLFPADRSVDLRSYVRAIIERRGYVWYVAISQLRRQQMDSVLGNLWHLLNPALQIAVYYIIFGVVLEVDRGVDNFVAFIAVGLFVFQFSQKSTMAGARSIATNWNLIRSLWFPRAMLPVTSTLTELLAFLPAVIVMLAVCVATGEPVLATWMLIPFLVVGQTMFNLGAALVVARLTNHVQDVQQLLPYIFRLLFYASGVLFLVDAYVSHSRWRLVFELNPFYGYVSLYRWAVLGFDVSQRLVLITMLWTVFLLVFALWWFKRAERSYGAA